MKPANPVRRIRWDLAAGASILLPAAAVAAQDGAWWTLVLFVLWTTGAAAVYVRRLRRAMRAQNVRMLDHARQSAIRMLSHHRHDWMNDLQILYGYIRLNKADKAAEIVERIRTRMESDSRISQLGNAELATFLLAFRTLCDHVRLEVRVEEGLALSRLPLDPDRLAGCLIGLINAIRYRAVPAKAGENVLRMSLRLNGDSLEAHFAYEGEWPAGGALVPDAADVMDGLGRWEETAGGAADDAAGARSQTRSGLAAFPLTA